MMNRICSSCNKVYKRGTECPNGCYVKYRKEYMKYRKDEIRDYDMNRRKNHDFYNSKSWKRLRDACKYRYSGLCLWSYFKYNKIIFGRIVHHIIPLELNKNLGLDIDNLIYLSDKAHAEIHGLYDESNPEKFIEQNESILKEITKYQERWKIEGV